MAAPFAREVHRNPEPRLQQLQARNTHHSTTQRHVLWSPAHRIWITVTPGPRGFVVEFYRSCPCE